MLYEKRWPFVRGHCSDCVQGCALAPEGRRNDLCPVLDQVLTEQRYLSPRKTLFHQGDRLDSFYVVESGWFCLYRLLEDGRRQILDFALPGDLIGYRGEATDRPADHAAMAMTAAQVCVGDQLRAATAFTEAPDLLARVNRFLLWEQQLTQTTLTIVARTSAMERVAYILYELALRLQQRAPENGDRITIPLTQEEIGDAVGLTSVHVSRMLGQLRREQVLRLQRGRLTVCDADRFASLANIDAEAALAAHYRSLPDRRERQCGRRVTKAATVETVALSSLR